MSDLLFAAVDLPIARRIEPANAPLTIQCVICGSINWIACAPGTASDASRYADSKIAEIRVTDDVPLVAWCVDCHPLVRRS